MLKSSWLKSGLPTLHRSIADSMQLPHFKVNFHEICSWSTASLASAWPSHSPERPQTSRPKRDQWNSGLISWNIQGHVVKHHNQWLIWRNVVENHMGDVFVEHHGPFFDCFLDSQKPNSVLPWAMQGTPWQLHCWAVSIHSNISS